MTLKEFFTTDIEATVFKYKNYVILMAEIMKIVKEENADKAFEDGYPLLQEIEEQLQELTQEIN